MADPEAVALTSDDTIDALLTGWKWNENELTYDFPATGAQYIAEQFLDSLDPVNFLDPTFLADLVDFAIDFLQDPDSAVGNFIGPLVVTPIATIGYDQFNAAQRAAAESALDQYAAVSGLSFEEGGVGFDWDLNPFDGDGIGFEFTFPEIRFAETDVTAAPAFGVPPLPQVEDLVGHGILGDTWYRNDGTFVDPVPGSFADWTILHETGHAVGLKHVHESGLFGGRFPDWLETAITGVSGPTLPAEWDSFEFTVMTYRSEIGGPASDLAEAFGHPQSLMMLDIQAIQHMYGPNFGFNSTDTTYSWDPATGTMSVNGTAGRTPGANRVFMTIWDGGGIDTYDLSAYTTDVVINLLPGEWTITSQDQLADLNGGDRSTGLARGNVANALLYMGDPRSMIENGIGGSGNDTLIGNVLDNVLTGNAGDDSLTGDEGDDTLNGGSGDDTLDGGDGDDTLNGGGGDDTLNGDAGDDTLDGGSGNDTLNGGAGHDTLNGADGNDTLNGNAGNDTLDGGDGNDTLDGATGDDTLLGGAGNDVLTAGDGNDAADGGDGDDQIDGGAGNDLLDGGNGNDNILGGLGSDVISAGAGVDTVSGGDGNDDISLGAGDDMATGGAGNDVIYGEDGDDDIDAGDGSDFVSGGAGDDQILGGSGNDILNGNDGIDTVDGEAGDDVVSGGAADDLLFGGSGLDTLFGDAGNDEVHGGDDDDTLHGGDGDDVMFGEGGSDRLFGESGNDILAGGAGPDLLDGGEGIDQAAYSDATGPVVVNQQDPTQNTGDAAGDTMISIEQFGLSEFDDTYIGFDAEDPIDWVFGRGGDDTLLGYAGDDILWGEDGDDFIVGGEGADEINGGNGFDTTSFRESKIGIVVDLTDPSRNTGIAEGDQITSIEQFLMTEQDDEFVGLDTDETIFGYHGNDLIFANGGDDTVFGGDQHDTLFGGAGNDALWGEDGVDTIDGGAGDDLLSGGPGTDTLIGGSGNDTIFGGDDRDVIVGGTGDDQLHGGEGRDQFVFAASGWGSDTIIGFEDGKDRITFLGFDAPHGRPAMSNLNIFDDVGGARVELAGGGPDSILLVGVSASDLNHKDFFFGFDTPGGGPATSNLNIFDNVGPAEGGPDSISLIGIAATGLDHQDVFFS